MTTARSSERFDPEPQGTDPPLPRTDREPKHSAAQPPMADPKPAKTDPTSPAISLQVPGMCRGFPKTDPDLPERDPTNEFAGLRGMSHAAPQAAL
jgi:hypothetical protein